MTPKRSRPLAIGIILFYLVIRFGFTNQLDGLGLYAVYIFEACFAAAVVLFYRPRLFFKLSFSKSLLFDGILALGTGLGIYALAHSFNFVIPWDLYDKETLLFLLLLGPLLEEFLFRQALWRPSEVLFSKFLTVIFTSALFSFGHFYAYFSVPAFLYSFIFFQTTYTFAVSLWWGLRYSQTGNLMVPLALHILFNFGFWIGYVAVH